MCDGETLRIGRAVAWLGSWKFENVGVWLGGRAVQLRSDEFAAIVGCWLGFGWLGNGLFLRARLRLMPNTMRNRHTASKKRLINSMMLIRMGFLVCWKVWTRKAALNVLPSVLL